MKFSKKPDFIGLGAQRSGTSWIYACLYEHPQICIPVKEIHFFSRDRNWLKGYEWYEKNFEKCIFNSKVGEFSTSYLSNPDTPVRIYQRYPESKLIVSLRFPIDRAYSNYRNDIMSGVVNSEMTFEEAIKNHPEYIERGRYAKHIESYLEYFKKDQILFLIYEDFIKDPLESIQNIYDFINVRTNFIPSMLHTRVNPGRVPRSVKLDRYLDRAHFIMRSIRLENLWWLMKKSGIGSKIRSLNTNKYKNNKMGPLLETRKLIYEILQSDIGLLENQIGRQLTEWRL